MAQYILQIIDANADGPREEAHDYASLEQARDGAKGALSDIAKEGLPCNPVNMLSVELFDADRVPIVEFRLVFEEIEKS